LPVRVAAFTISTHSESDGGGIAHSVEHSDREKFATQRGFQLFIAVKLIRFNRRTGSVKSPLKKFSIERV
jgi:hypothetical protein